MEMLSKKIGDASICRRMVFATLFLPKDYPNYCKMVSNFEPKIEVNICCVLMENVEALSPELFVSDMKFIQEIVDMKLEPTDNHPIGIVLISHVTVCLTCNSTMCTCSDRPNHLTLYTTNMGTIRATHYHKLCSNRKCKTIQFYEYTTTFGTNSLCYDEDYLSLLYFITSQETAFEMDFLHKFDAELLIGQISYLQKSEIFNYHNEYPSVKKLHSTRSRKEEKLDAELATMAVERLVVRNNYHVCKYSYCVVYGATCLKF